MNLITANKTMSSREIAELTGKQHGHVKRDIVNMLHDLIEDVSKFGRTYMDGSNRVQTEYSLERDYVDCLLTGYSAKARMNVIKRWKELEGENSKPAWLANLSPQAMAAIEDLNSQLEAVKPIVEFYEQVTGSADTVDMSQAAKVLNMGVGRNKMFQLLRDKKVLQPNNEPYQAFIDRGYFRMVESRFQKPSGDTCINIKTVVYQKGLDYIRKLLNKESN